ncbi:hypothetical protein DL96DRAFT_1625348 [Flagelloscypha sp. PMI_526]|nr:hypothetical protein DL96DRAFT_1625348 [Flagelloscypha sp. PMI_526]
MPPASPLTPTRPALCSPQQATFLATFVILFYRAIQEIINYFLPTFPLLSQAVLRRQGDNEMSSTSSSKMQVVSSTSSSSSQTSSESYSSLSERLAETEQAYRLHIISTRQALMALESENHKLSQQITLLNQFNRFLVHRSKTESHRALTIKQRSAENALGSFLEVLVLKNQALKQGKEIRALEEEKARMETVRLARLKRLGRKAMAEREKQAMVENFVKDIVSQHAEEISSLTQQAEEWRDKCRQEEEETKKLKLKVEAAKVQEVLAEEVERALLKRICDLEEKVKGAKRMRPRGRTMVVDTAPMILDIVNEEDEVTPKSLTTSDPGRLRIVGMRGHV